jgi:hypothetical protein
LDYAPGRSFIPYPEAGGDGLMKNSTLARKKTPPQLTVDQAFGLRLFRRMLSNQG